MKVLFVSSGNIKNFEVVPFIREQGESLRTIGIDVDYYPVVGKGMMGYLKAAMRLRKMVRQNKYDLIHAHFTLSGVVAVLGSSSVPVVLSLMGSDAYGEYVGVNRITFASRFMMALTWVIQPFVRAIISKSNNIDRFVWARRKSFIIPNGIDVRKFTPTTSCRSDLGLSDDKSYVLFLGSQRSVRKNLGLARRAMQHVKMDNVELINPYPVSHTEIPKYLNSVNVLAVCSFMEGSPNVVKEAMSCNCPIVTTDVGDVKWVLGETPGCYLATFDAPVYGAKLAEALRFSHTTGRTTGRGRMMELGLDSNTVAHRVKEIYDKVLAI